MVDAINGLQRDKVLNQDPVVGLMSAISVGVYQGECVLDLDYDEDSSADTDMNVIALEDKGLVEIQGTAEGAAFDQRAKSFAGLGRNWHPAIVPRPARGVGAGLKLDIVVDDQRCMIAESSLGVVAGG